MHYLLANAEHALPLEALLREVEKVRRWRLRDYLKKVGRDCSLFAASIGAFGLRVVRREHDAELAPLLLGERFRESSAEQRCAEFINELAALNERCGLPSRLRDAGVPETMLPTMARDAMLQQRLLVNNPREVSEADALDIYQAAY